MIIKELKLSPVLIQNRIQVVTREINFQQKRSRRKEQEDLERHNQIPMEEVNVLGRLVVDGVGVVVMTKVLLKARAGLEPSHQLHLLSYPHLLMITQKLRQLPTWKKVRCQMMSGINKRNFGMAMMKI